jgi:hypothetical protein
MKGITPNPMSHLVPLLEFNHRWIGLKIELKVPVIAGLFAIAVAIVTGIFNLGVAIYNGFKASPTPTPVVSAAPMPSSSSTPTPTPRNDPPLPGDTGWIFAGYYLPNEKRWVEGPWVSLPEKQSSATLPIEIGDQVEVSKAELRYIIVDYKVSGFTNRLIPPAEIPGGVLRDIDDTGFKVNKGRRLFVRDISVAAFPGRPSAYWLRIVSADHP